MEVIARSILDNGQTTYDGGIIRYILENVEWINNNNLINDVFSYLSFTKSTGGYGAGIFFGIIWLLGFCILVGFSCYLNRNYVKRKDEEIQSHMENKQKFRHFNMNTETYLLISTIAMLCLLGIFILCFIVNSIQFQSSIKQSSKGFNVNGSTPSAIRPAIKTSIHYMKIYVSKFLNETSRITSLHALDLIKRTDKIQNEALNIFIESLIKKIHGGSSIIEIVDAMKDFIDMCGIMKTSMKTIKSSKSLILVGTYDYHGLLTIIDKIKNELRLKDCDQKCKYLNSYFKGYFNNELTIFKNSFHISHCLSYINTTNAKKQINNVIDYNNKNLEKVKSMIATEIKKGFNVSQYIRKNINETLDLMDKKRPKIMKTIDSFMKTIEDKIDKKISEISLSTEFIFAISILFMLIFVGLSIVYKMYPNYCFKQNETNHNILKIAIQSCCGLIAIVLVMTMVVYLHGGKYETEFCRYIRTNQPIITTNNVQHFLLDSYLNEAIQKLIKEYVKSKTNIQTIPKLNIFYGLIHNCKLNKPFFKAIGLSEKFKLTAYVNLSTIYSIINSSGQSINESVFNEYIDKKMIGIVNNTVELIKNISSIHDRFTYKKPIILLYKRINRKQMSINNSKLKGMLTDFQTSYDIEKIIKTSINSVINLINTFEKTMVTLEKYEKPKEYLSNILKLQKKIKREYSNHSELLTIVNTIYHETIETQVPEKIMEEINNFGLKIMGELGHCQSIYQAYESTVDTICDIALPKLNASWVYMGTCVLIMTLLWLEMIYGIYKNRMNDEAIENTDDIPMDNVQMPYSHESDPIVHQVDMKPVDSSG